MNSNWYQVKYMSQNALSYTFFYKRIFEAIRKVYLSLFVVEIKLGCKERKVQEDKYEHYHQQILKNCSAILTNLSIFTKITQKKWENFAILRGQNGKSWITFLHS